MWIIRQEVFLKTASPPLNTRSRRVKAITQLKAEAYVLLILMNFKDAQACHALYPNVMMEVMIPTLEKAKQFDQMGVPWRNIVAFVGHTPPEDREYRVFLDRGADVIETDIPTLLGKLLSGPTAPSSTSGFFHPK